LHAEALTLVKARYKNLAEKGYIKDSALTDARKKMAYLPKGATAVANPVGTAPATVLQIGVSTLVSLPGVPDEMKGIYEETLPPTLRAIFGDSYYQETAIIAHCGDESSLAPILADVVDAHPEVYIKSRARRYGPEVRILLTLSAAGDARGEVERRIQSALDALIAVLATAGFEVEDQPSD
jgi:molybdopterin-biosynthesis enzyme MoeA-like protein